MSLVRALYGLTILNFLTAVANGQLLKLKVEPPFEFVNENWTVGRALPSMSVCVQYSGARPLTMVISSGDPFNYFRLSPINDTCWSLILQKGLDADIVNSDGSRGQSFSLTFRCSDGKIQAYGNADVQTVDLNDFEPRFVDTKSAVSVPEDATCGQVILTVTTFDPDTGVGGINSFLLEDDYKETFLLRNGSCFDAHCTADILLNSKLNYDQKNVYSLTVVAFDGAGRSKVVNEARFPVVVTVLDVENNPPRFLVDNRVQFVPEDAPTGSEVFLVYAYDGDAGVPQPRPIRYSLSGENEYFGINATSGWVFVKTSLDRENPDILRSNGAVNLVIVAEEDVPEPEPRPSSSLKVTIIISDINDEPPRCNLTSYTAEVAENSQRFVPITLTNALELYVYDNDEGVNGEFKVSLVDHEGIFDVTPKHIYNVGTVLVRVYNTSALDYETRQTFNFKLVLTPASEPRKKAPIIPSYCDISVQLLNTNDNRPVFNKSFMVAHVLENQPVGTFVTDIPVYDVDSAQYLPIVVKLSGVGSELFYVDQADGAVKTNAVLDRENKADYQLTVTAVDENGRGNSNSATLRINIGDENDNFPLFVKSVYVAYLPENDISFLHLPNGLFVEATDADEPDTPNSNITYSLEADGFVAEYFRIDSNTGQVLPLPPGVDLEAMPSDYLNITVIAQDQSVVKPLTSFAILLIYVNDTNDFQPVFSQPVYAVSIFENVTSGDFVTDVSATDNDRSTFNNQVAYRIVDVQDKFIIDSQTGRILVASGASLDRDLTKKDQYSLTVVALDQGVPPQTGSATLEIDVIDLNNKPPRFTEKLLTVKLLEDSPIGTPLVNVTAYDSDIDAQLRYQIVGYKEGSASDSENSIFTTYSGGEPFGIDETTGQMFTTGVLDRETLERIVLAVNVTDVSGVFHTPQTAQILLEIWLLDVNDNSPVFLNQFYAKSVLENAELGSIILTVSAADKDQNRSVTYAIEDQSNVAPQLVDVGRTSGEVTVASVIDYEQIQWINFTIIATDTGVPPLSNRTTVSLRVLDQNDNSPVFQPSPTYLATISEDSLPGQFVVQVSATDADSGSYGQISYFLLNDLETAPHFAINETTGVVYVIAQLDREIKAEYTLTVRAIDDYNGRVAPGSHESTSVVRVTLTDVNDFAPAYAANTPKMVALTENNAAGALVIMLAATDKDDPATGNGQVRFSIVDGNGSIYKNEKRVDLFSLDSTTGSIRLAENLTGLNGLYWLTIEAKDMGTPEPLATKINVTFRVQDYNDHKPVIITPKQHEVFHVAENNYSDFYAITKLTAVDTDEGVNSELHYSLKQTSTNEDWMYFHVDAVSGDVFQRQAFDYERQNRYELTAQACDYGQPSLCDEVEFTLLILDQNDNCPGWVKRQLNYTHELEIKENQPPDSVVGDVLQAMDKDTDVENIRICYDIVGGAERQSFRMASPNGTRLVTTASLDRESRSAYELVIKTRDCQGNEVCSQGAEMERGDKTEYSPADVSLLRVRITVLDDNDQIPFFVQPSYRGGVRYDTRIGSRVARVRAEDLDSMDNGRLVYSLNGPIKANLLDSESYDVQKPPFLVNETTGDIVSNILFPPSWKGTFEVPVGVKDLAEHAAGVTVIINLLRFDQQLELIFEAQVNQVWDEAHDIIKYLSVATDSNATIDDVLPYQSFVSNSATETDESGLKVTTSKRIQSKVLVHFVDDSQAIVAIDSALQLLDRPRTIEQKQAKHHLISIHHLRYAAQNSDPAVASAFYKSDAQTLTALAGVVGGLVLVLSVLIATWCIQSRTYKRKLKAASTLAFSSNDMTVPAYDLPGTNLHANSNPVWSPDGAHFSFENDQHSPRSGNDSLDDNELAYEIEKAARDCPDTPSTAVLGSQFFVGSSTTSGAILQLHAGRDVSDRVARDGETHGNGNNTIVEEDSSDDGDSNGSIPPPPVVTLDESRRNYNGNGILIRNGSRPPQPSNFPRPLVSTLESTEL